MNYRIIKSCENFKVFVDSEEYDGCLCCSMEVLWRKKKHSMYVQSINVTETNGNKQL